MFTIAVSQFLDLFAGAGRLVSGCNPFPECRAFSLERIGLLRKFKGDIRRLSMLRALDLSQFSVEIVAEYPFLGVEGFDRPKRRGMLRFLKCCNGMYDLS